MAEFGFVTLEVIAHKTFLTIRKVVCRLLRKLDPGILRGLWAN